LQYRFASGADSKEEDETKSKSETGVRDLRESGVADDTTVVVSEEDSKKKQKGAVLVGYTTCSSSITTFGW
jgi:hypothetical protein